MRPRVLLFFWLLCQPAFSQEITVYFSPKGGSTEAVVRELEAAKSMVRVQAYSFTSAPIARALVHAHNRGVQVEVILDDSQARRNTAKRISFAMPASRCGSMRGTPPPITR